MTSTTTIKSTVSKIESAISYQLSAIQKFRRGKLGNLFKQGLGKLIFKEPQLRKHGIMVCLTFLMFIASFTKAQQVAWRIGDTEVNFGTSTATTTTIGIDPFGSLGYNSMTTPSGKILFYVDNGSVFLGDGTFIGDIMVDFYYNNVLASKKLGGYPEICIVPKPGSCSHYYIIGGYAKYESSNLGTGGTDPDLVFAEIDLEKENPLYPKPNKIGNFVGATL